MKEEDLKPVAGKNKPGPKLHRTTIVLQAYHEQAGEGANQFTVRGSHTTPTIDEDPWERRMKLTEEWEPVDFGWLSEVGLVILENIGHPSNKKRKEGGDVEVAFRGGKEADCIIPVSLPMVFHATDVSGIRVRSLNKSRLRVVALPAEEEDNG